MLVLKEQLVLEKTKAENLASVRNLNLWGEGLSDVAIVEKMTSIEVLALAANQITTLSHFASCTTLRELYLRKNNIVSLGDVKYIKDLPHLRTLWLMDNPCARHPNYRLFVIACCPNLKQLDNIEVTDKEREEARKKLPEKAIREIMEQGLADLTNVNGNRTHSPTSGRPGVVKPTERRSSGAKQLKDKSSGVPLCRDREDIMSPKPPARAAKGSDGAASSSSFTTVQTQRAMLTSIVSLVSELTLESLEMLQKEIRVEIEKRNASQRAKGRP